MSAGETMKRQPGFTLIELMVTIVVAVILATVAVPGFQRIMATNRIAADYNEALSGLNFARSEAIKRRVEDTFEVSGESPWSYEVTVDGTLLRSRSGRDGRTGLELEENVDDVVFGPLGRPVEDCSDGCVVTLVSNMSGADNREIIISTMGRVSRAP